jgi:hypothetical protein
MLIVKIYNNAIKRNALKRKVALRILLQRTLVGEKE